MKKWILKTTIIIFLSTCCLTACEKSNDDIPLKASHSESTISNNAQFESLPDESFLENIISIQVKDKKMDSESHIIKTLSSGVQIDADIQFPLSMNIDTLSECKAQPVIQDYEKAKKIFLTDKKMILKLKSKSREMITSRYEQKMVWGALLAEYKRLEQNTK